MTDEESPVDTSPPPALDLRAARVVAAGPHPNADRLMLLQVDLGEETRQIVAGVVGHYAPEEIQEKTIVIVANLKPARLRGEESQGMILAAEDEQGEMGLLLAPDATPGTPVLAHDNSAELRQITFAEFQRHSLIAGREAITFDGAPVANVRLVVDRNVVGRLR